MLTSTVLPIMLSPIAAKCKEPKKPTPNPETPSEPEETEKDKKIKEINKWLDEEVNGNLSIIEGKEKEFYKAINDGNDFWYDRNTGKVITTKKGERPDWKNNKNYLFFPAAFNKARNNGWGLATVDLYSGWYCTPI